MRYLCLGVAALCCALLSEPGHAAAIAFQDPATANWGGWSRGQTGSVSVAWEKFDSCVMNGVCVALPDRSPDVGNLGTVPGRSVIIPNNPGAFITGSGLGGNIYSFGDIPDFDVIIQPAATHLPPVGKIGYVTVALQLAILGVDLNDSTVKLNGLTYSSKTVLKQKTTTAGQGGIDNEYLYLWANLVASPVYVFDFTAARSSLSLDHVAIDVGPYRLVQTPPITPIPPVGQVPLPAAGWLLISGLGLLGSFRRTRKTVAPRASL